MKSQELSIRAVTPAIGIPGGEISIQCSGFKPGLPSVSKVLFGTTEADIVSASEERVIVKVPEGAQGLGVALSVDGAKSAMFPLILGARLATGLHPVANPVVAVDGAVITTISGARGQRSPRSLVKVSKSGDVTAFACEIMNPTGLAFSPSGQLYISSRADGTVLRYTDFQKLEVVAEDLGVPCGIAFDAKERLYVGDRTGKIIRIGSTGSHEEFAAIPPSVSAFHLAFDRNDNLYVTGPTVAIRDPVYRITRKGEVSILLEGLARPQGLAVGHDGDLWIATAYGGKKGIFRCSLKRKELVHYIAAPMLVGLALDGNDVLLADNSSIYWIRMGGPSGRVS
jgi:sugar lactone lactonase YvrE